MVISSSPKPIYIFDLIGNLLQEFEGEKKVAKFLNRRPSAVLFAINRKSVISGMYYASYAKDFCIPKKAISRNPVYFFTQPSPDRFRGEKNGPGCINLKDVHEYYTRDFDPYDDDFDFYTYKYFLHCQAVNLNCIKVAKP